MREVIYINKEKREEKPVEFTGFLSGRDGWVTGKMRQPKDAIVGKEIFYLGKCNDNGDMFMDVDSTGQICIFKGHLNSGKY
jgi:hypothetical protein